MALLTGGSVPADLQPTQTKSLYTGNYIDFTAGTFNQWSQQFLPDIYEKEVEIYGNRTIAGFLKMMSAEMPSTSDQIIWTEQGRLHTRYSGATVVSAAAGSTAANIGLGAASAHFTVPGAQPGQTITAINFRVGETVMIQQEAHTTSPAANSRRGGLANPVLKGIVTAVNTLNFSVSFYNRDEVAAVTAGSTVSFTALAYGSEFAKGTTNFTDKKDPNYSTYSNQPIILKDHYGINGSDTSQIGWIEVTSENGASGYLWYIKAEHENRLRWEDYMEMSMVEGVTAVNAAGADATITAPTTFNSGGNFNGVNVKGTEGFFQALEERGNSYEGLAADLAYSSSTAGLERLNDSFDEIIKQMDKQGAIQENMLYVNRALSFGFTDVLAQVNNGGGTSGVSFGMFDNKMDNAVDLGFSGFRRGSYDFYQTDWKYLNDWATRGGFGNIEGVLVPAGTSTVYDQVLGKNISRPFLHVRYRASEADNRKNKSWVTGSVSGTYTTDADELRIHNLSERCLITQGANNFFLLEGNGNS